MNIISKDVNFKLVVDTKIDDNVYLYKTEPFEWDKLNVNCERCKYFWTTPMINPSGICKKYDISCGVGFACNDYEERNV